MDPANQRFATSPRDINVDAFFATDRAAAPRRSSVAQADLNPRGRENPAAYEKAVLDGTRDRTTPAGVPVTVFPSRHLTEFRRFPNPLPHARRLPPVNGKPGPIDTTLATWKDSAGYTLYFTPSAQPTPSTTPRPRVLRVTILFGTGSEFARHGVCGVLENSAEATLLINVDGVEPTQTKEFAEPNSTRKVRLVANNRWGRGITVTTIETIIAEKYGQAVPYAIVTLAAFSTGHYGLQGVIEKKLIPLDKLERVIIYDCLYGSLGPALNRIKAMKSSAHIIAYVVTESGNSFRTAKPNSDGAPSARQGATFKDLELGGNPQWNYIDLMGNTNFHAITSARIIAEARDPQVRLIDPVTPAYETALNNLVATIVPRNTVVSDAALFRKIRGTLPAYARTLADVAGSTATAAAITAFRGFGDTTRRCIGRAQLMGWPSPPGEEWHDMLLVEFGWEFLG